MAPKNSGGLFFLLAFGPYAFFCLLLCILLPPIGFLMALARFKQKRMMNERGYGYVFLMALSVFTSIFIIYSLIDCN